MRTRASPVFSAIMPLSWRRTVESGPNASQAGIIDRFE
jgi:hypothetical protein